MIDRTYILLHRILNTTPVVEHLISIVPWESLDNTIKRIRPASGDEIVIKVMDPLLPANQQAERDTEDIFTAFMTQEELKQRLTTASPDDGPF